MVVVMGESRHGRKRPARPSLPIRRRRLVRRQAKRDWVIMKYDVIVVGARCAGAPTAMLLARKGHKVLLVDRACFPSDVISGHFIKPAGTARLKRWGLLDRLMATGCPPVKKRRVTFGTAFTSEGESPPGAVGSLAPRRFILDAVLVEAAIASGVEFRQGLTVKELLWENERVIGITGANAGGRAFAERARLVIGADGRHSLVARLAGAATYRAVPAVSIGYYAYWTGCVTTNAVELFFSERRAVGCFPTHDQQALIWTQWPWQERHAFKAALESNYLKSLAAVPWMAEHLENGHRVGPILGMVDLPNFFRVPFGQGWALVGDAGHHKDPLVARGISDAFRDAELLANAAHRALAGEADMAASLQQYQCERDAAAIAVSDLNVELARLDQPLDAMIAIFRKLGEAEEATDKLYS